MMDRMEKDRRVMRTMDNPKMGLPEEDKKTLVERKRDKLRSVKTLKGSLSKNLAEEEFPEQEALKDMGKEKR